MSKENPGRKAAQDADATPELDFERDDGREGVIGDPKPEKEIREEFPGRRGRQAGMTGGADAHGGVAE